MQHPNLNHDNEGEGAWKGSIHMRSGWKKKAYRSSGTQRLYMSFQGGTALKYQGIIGVENNMEGAKSVKLGGRQIEYEDEDPQIQRLFKEELAKNGAPWRMAQYFPGE